MFNSKEDVYSEKYCQHSLLAADCAETIQQRPHVVLCTMRHCGRCDWRMTRASRHGVRTGVRSSVGGEWMWRLS